MLDAALRLDQPVLNKLSRPSLLAPIIGTVVPMPSKLAKPECRRPLPSTF